MKTIKQDAENLVSADFLSQGLKERPNELDEGFHRQVVKRVIRMYQAMKRDQKQADPVYQPGGEWAEYLRERQEFHDRMLAGDVGYCLGKLTNFWRNELGPIVKEYARYDQLARQQPESIIRFQKNVARNFLIWKEIHGGNASLLRVPRVGNPWGAMIEQQLVVPKATRFHALSQQLQALTRDRSHALVAEIGGGYGGVPYYLLRDRPNTTYVDFDLPETVVLAAYYLLCCLPNHRILLYGESQITAPEEMAGYDAVLLPNYELPALATSSVDVFFNSFSFSEIPFGTLKEYLVQVKRTCRGYFLHNNMDRRGVINRGYQRIPASDYPVDMKAFKCLYKQFDLFHGCEGDYREFLYERTAA